MKTVKRTMHFPKFNEKRNDFEYEERTYEREMTEQERDLQVRYGWLMALIFAYMVAFVGGLIVALATKTDLWDLTLIPLTFVWCWLLAKMFDTLLKWEDKIDSFNDYGFDAEVLQWEQIAQEENDKAAKWREAHPLEEAIRKVQQTKNCNDIAALLKLYQSGDLKM